MLTRRQHLRLCFGFLAGSFLQVGSGSAKCKSDPPVAPASGLLDPTIARYYVTQVRTLAQRWPGLSIQQRMQPLVNAINEALKRAQVPEVIGRLPLEPLASPRKAEFASRVWEFHLDRSYLSQLQISEEETAELGALVYHEGRHAEQYCIMARTIAGLLPMAERKSGAIRKMLIISPRATLWAVRHPIFAGDARARLTHPWLAAVARGSVHEERALAGALETLEKTSKERSAVTIAAAGGSPAGEAVQKRYDEARIRYQAAWEAYFCLPLEADAQRAYDLIARLWKERTP